MFLVFVFKDPSPGEPPPRPPPDNSPGASAPEVIVPETEITDPAILAADAALTTQVEAALKANPDTKSLKIKVRVRDGAVRITGDVSGGGEKDHVSEVTKNVPGVKGLRNDITVHDNGN